MSKEIIINNNSSERQSTLYKHLEKKYTFIINFFAEKFYKMGFKKFDYKNDLNEYQREAFHDINSMMIDFDISSKLSQTEPEEEISIIQELNLDGLDHRMNYKQSLLNFTKSQ